VRSLYAPTKSENQRADARAGGIVAKLSDSDTAAALGLTAQSSSPVLALCRKLVESGHDPDRPLHAYWGDALCLRVRSIGEAARLEINAKGTGFVARHAVRTASPIAPNAPARTGYPTRARRTGRQPVREAAE
jgi:hypothetical protein